MKKNKKYLLFYGEKYYPEGGALDLKAEVESVDVGKEIFKEAQAADNEISWCNILNKETLGIMAMYYDREWQEEPPWHLTLDCDNEKTLPSFLFKKQDI